jgi:hypothetical protein
MSKKQNGERQGDVFREEAVCTMVSRDLIKGDMIMYKTEHELISNNIFMEAEEQYKGNVGITKVGVGKGVCGIVIEEYTFNTKECKEMIWYIEEEVKKNKGLHCFTKKIPFENDPVKECLGSIEIYIRERA